MASDERDALVFARRWLPSVWTLELLILIQADRSRAWSVEQLIRELRASIAIVSESLRRLESAGLIAKGADDMFRFSPRTGDLAETVVALHRLYLEKPTVLVREIMSTPNDKIQTFADAFRIKRQDP